MELPRGAGHSRDHRRAPPPASYPTATDAPLLRHRLFPRAMAWDATLAAAAGDDDPSDAFAHAVSLQERVPAAAVHEALSFARSLPLLHAASGAIESELRRQKENRSHENSAGNPFLAGAPPSQEAREKLFRTMGKWFDGPGSGSNSAANSRASFASSTGSAPQSDDGFLQHIPRRANFENVAPPPVLSISFASTVATSFASLEGRSFAPAPPPPPPGTSDSARGRLHVAPNERPTAASFADAPLPVHVESRGTPSPTHSTSNWSEASEPRAGGLTRSPSRTPSAAHGKKRQRATPAPSLAKALLTGCGAKRCSFDDCVKIAVSKGLCRGHGGGRRCQFAGCSKCAQSRSPFCWAHGGGKRCEAPNCRRSRKTKHFCVDHVEMEAQLLAASGASPADSDESMDGGGGGSGGAMAELDAALAPAQVTKSFSASDLEARGGAPALFERPFQASRASGDASMSASATLARQLPSLNDALKRSFASPDAYQVAQANELLLMRLQQQQQQQQLHHHRQQSQRFNFDIRR
ncbi:hypothetical protein PybrP1_013071 [[Pythium] brassicae (nom. inval.)]|nr:hypothetical protein PybrP1_013071 [[Pythium] brassicae (nom. inval.)]